MKRVMKIKAKLPNEEIEIIVRLKRDYSDSFYPRKEANKRINELTNKVVSEILLPENIDFKDIKLKK